MLGINIYSLGSQYLISAIYKCYYHPEYFTTLDNLYLIISNEYNVSKEQIKNSIRHTIDTFNRNYNVSDKSLYFSIFQTLKDISPKQFIQMFINYLQTVKDSSNF